MRTRPLISALCLFGLLFAVDAIAGPFAKKSEEDRTAEVKEAIAKFKAHDPSIEEFFKKAEGYAVYPTVAKGGMGVGAAVGKGQVYEKDKLVGDSTLKQASFGFQLGGQTYSEIIFFETTKALENFKTGKFELGAQVSAVALTKGVAAGAEFSNGIAVFTMTKKGLMYEAAVAGQHFSFKPVKE